MSSSSIKYEEQSELTKYVWRSFRHLMNSDELLADNAFSVEAKIKGSHGSGPQFLVEERNRYQSNAYVQQALRLGYDGFQDSVRDRMMRDMPESFFVSRCQACQRIVATSEAKQCLWCGENWHAAD